MKQLLVLIFAAMATFVANARDVDGYFLTTNNDTVLCKIRVKGIDLFDKVVILDSAGNKVSHKARDLDINGFGFVFENRRYDYVLKADEKSNWSFLIRQATGPRIMLYYSWDVVHTGNGSYRVDCYMLEDSAKKSLNVRGGLFSGYKKQIRRFLNGNTTLLDLFDRRVSNITDIPEFVHEANELP